VSITDRKRCRSPAVWFPAIRVGTGVDVFTERLCAGLNARGIRAEIAWLARRAEYLPWTVRAPQPPAWANVVHVNTWMHRRFVPSRLCVVATIHHSVHDARLRPYKSHLQALYHRQWVRPMEHWILQRANAVTTVSHYTAEKAREHFGLDSIHVIHNGVPVPRQLQRYRKPHRPFRLLYVGSWSMRKGVDLLGPIMQQLGDDFELHYTADKNVRVRLPVNCRSLGRPNQSKLLDAYRDSDALLFPTRLEGFGQVALEAMAHGLPVISTNGTALPEVVENGRNGILCPQDDVAAFAAAARRLEQDQELWSSMSEAAITHARRPAFSIASMVDSYAQIYEATWQACEAGEVRGH
jgi:glycosyltransferase involved in cell wall biosynthesis